jgi:hypothetical protein
LININNNTDSQIPSDEDTKILFRQRVKFGELDAFWEHWSADGFTGYSVIFDKRELPADICELTLIDQVKQAVSHISRDTTISREGNFLFVNYGFDLES